VQSMKIILVGPSNRFQGGISSYLEYTALQLAEEGNEVGIIFFDRLLPSFLYPGRDRLNENPTLSFDHENIETLFVMNYYGILVPSEAKEKIAAFNPDFVIFHWWTFAVFPMIKRVARIMSDFRYRYYFEIHEVIDQNDSRIPMVSRISRMLGGRLLNRGSALVAHSSTDVKQISSHYGVEPDKVKVIPLANINLYGPRSSKAEAREKLGIDHRKVILFFGLIRKYKGVLELIRAFEGAVGTEDTLLLIVGEIWDEKNSIMSAKNESVRKKDILLIDRFVKDSEISTIYSSADVLAMPYSRASQSAVGGIAMEYGIPIVAYSVGGLKEALDNYDNGYLIDSGNTNQFSAGLAEGINRSLLPSSGGNNVKDIIKAWIELDGGRSSG